MSAKKIFFAWIFAFLILSGFFYYAMNNIAEQPFFSLLITSITFVYHLLIRFFLGPIGNLLTIRLPNLNSFWFKKHNWEDDFYKKIKIKNWKDKQLTFEPESFNLKKVGLDKLKHTMVSSEVVHELCILGSLCSIFMCFITGWEFYPLFLITGLLACIPELRLIFTQRYNRFRIERILKKQKNCK